MALWKYKLSDGWHILYGGILSKVMRKDKNLSDLQDIAIARENLELVGDVTTHNHDTRYQTQINILTEQLDSAKARITALETTCTQLQNTINSIQSANTANANNITAIQNKLANVPNIYVQTGQPSGVENKSIWINVSSNSESIKVLWSGAWKNIGAFWK